MRKTTPSPRQAEYLAHRDEFHREHQRFPTLRESAAVIGITCSGIQRMRETLAAKGLVSWEYGKSRGDTKPLKLPPVSPQGTLSLHEVGYLALLRQSLTTAGRVPSLREDARRLGYSSPVSVLNLRHALARKGYLEIEPNKSRAVRLTAKCFAPSPSRKGA